jgi:hypothetical protein
MARLPRNTVDYFPHFAGASEGDTLTILQDRFGNDGYAFWFRLLEKLAGTDGHFLDCSNHAKWQLLQAKTHVSPEKAEQIMVVLAELEAIDRNLWEKSRIIWVQNLVENVAGVYENRRRQPPLKPIQVDEEKITTCRNCTVCGKTLQNMRDDAKYCSDSCRKKSHHGTDNGTDNFNTESISTGNNSITTSRNKTEPHLNNLDSTPEIPQRKKESIESIVKERETPLPPKESPPTVGVSVSLSDINDVKEICKLNLIEDLPGDDEIIKATINEYTKSWIVSAVKESCRSNNLSWGYVLGILRNCKAEQHAPGEARSAPTSSCAGCNHIRNRNGQPPSCAVGHHPPAKCEDYSPSRARKVH